MTVIRLLLSASVMLPLLAGCLGYPDNVRPVAGFDLSRYLGTWYEIARLDHSFERGLSDVSAKYTLRDGGGVQVRNRGYAPNSGQWKEADGKAYFVEGADHGYLKVSFFGPFYGSYVIFELDADDYEYAFVCGPNRSYLWLLARRTEVPAELKARFVERARGLGFDVSRLIWVNHGSPAKSRSSTNPGS